MTPVIGNTELPTVDNLSSQVLGVPAVLVGPARAELAHAAERAQRDRSFALDAVARAR